MFKLKKSLLLTGVLASLLLFSACQKSTGTESKSEESSFSDVEVSAAKDSKSKDFSGQEEIGDGTIDLASPSGSTRDGKIPVVYYDKETFPTRVEVSSENIEGGQLSYLYVDGELIDTRQMGTYSGELQLQDNKNAISEGKHTVQLVQYVDDKEDGEVTTFKTQEYEIKLK